VAKNTPLCTGNLENPIANPMTAQKSMPRIDIASRHRDTASVTIKISSFMNDVG
jgi:hypothetical protein